MSERAVADQDRVRRFVVEDEAVRGQVVRLAATWTALREHAHYPEPVRRLLGEAISACVLLASTLKFQGSLTLQLEAAGAVRLLVAQCTDDFRVRGVARFDAARVAPSFDELVGAGRIVVTVESGESGSRYQGIVAIDGGSLAASLEHYFANSEQMPTCVRLAADDAMAGGLLIQRLPQEGGSRDASPGAGSQHDEQRRISSAQQTWDSAHEELQALDAAELLLRSTEDLVLRCFGARDVRLFQGAPVRFECRCNPERVIAILRSLGEQEVREVLAEQGSVTVTCEFCHRPYRFDPIDVRQLFAPPTAPGSDRIN